MFGTNMVMDLRFQDQTMTLELVATRAQITANIDFNIGAWILFPNNTDVWCITVCQTTICCFTGETCNHLIFVPNDPYFILF